MQLSIKLLAISSLAAYAKAQGTVSHPNSITTTETSSAAWQTSSGSESASSASSSAMSASSSVASEQSSGMSSATQSALSVLSSIASQASTAISPSGTRSSAGALSTNAVGNAAALALVGFVAALV